MEDEEFPIDKIKDHKLFDVLISETANGKACFNPQSLELDLPTHSKYAYLVHWKNYGIDERTWEPEDNLENTEQLKEYKLKRGLPMTHEKFNKKYGPLVYRQIQFAAEKVEGFQYLLSRKELKRAKEMNERVPAGPVKKREKTGLQKDEVPKKKRSLEGGEKNSSSKALEPDVENRTQSSKIARKDVQSSSNSIQLPGIQPLASNTQRIQKKPASSTASTSRSSDDGPSDSSTSISDDIQFIEEKKSIKKRIKNDFITPLTPANIKSLVTVKKQFFVEEKPMTKTKANPMKKELKEQIVERKEDVKELKKDIELINRKLAKYPVEIGISRASRTFSTSLEMMKTRRWRSTENLAEFWVKHAEFELFANNFTKMRITGEREKCYVLKLKENKNQKRTSKSRPIEELADPGLQKLADENWNRVKKMKVLKNLDDSLVKLLEQLVIAFSFDLTVQFERLFNDRLTESTFDAFRYIAIVLITTQCRHRYWEVDGKSLPLFESKSSTTWGKVRQQETECCENHRKCTWIEIFMKLTPPEMRFLETSEFSYHDLENEDDGPFRDDIFFHCMKNGAECQKYLFFKYSKPIGIQEDTVDDYSVDVMHMLAVQHGNLQRIGWYMANGGTDINALATHLPTKKVLRLQEYLKEWINENVKEEEHEVYYQRLFEMVKNTANTLEMFVENQLTQMISRRMAGRWKHMDLTYPHILRCSPLSNQSNCGDGTHQVLSCLFHSQVMGLRDGLPATGQGPYDEEKIEKLRANLRKYQRMVGDKKGRVLLAIYRINIGFQAKLQKNQPYSLPSFELVESDQGFEIENMTLLRQTEGLPAEEVDLNMEELKPLSSPGCRYFVLNSQHVEKELVVPGNAHIEMLAEVDEPITFAVQVFFIKTNS